MLRKNDTRAHILSVLLTLAVSLSVIAVVFLCLPGRFARIPTPEAPLPEPLALPGTAAPDEFLMPPSETTAEEETTAAETTADAVTTAIETTADAVTTAIETTAPVTDAVTEKITPPKTVTKTVTEKQTEPVTQPVTEPVTEPITEPVTEPVTEPETPSPRGLLPAIVDTVKDAAESLWEDIGNIRLFPKLPVPEAKPELRVDEATEIQYLEKAVREFGVELSSVTDPEIYMHYVGTLRGYALFVNFTADGMRYEAEYDLRDGRVIFSDSHPLA